MKNEFGEKVEKERSGRRLWTTLERGEEGSGQRRVKRGLYHPVVLKAQLELTLSLAMSPFALLFVILFLQQG